MHEREPIILRTDRGYFIIRDTPEINDTIGPLQTRETVRQELLRMRGMDA